MSYDTWKLADPYYAEIALPICPVCVTNEVQTHEDTLCPPCQADIGKFTIDDLAASFRNIETDPNTFRELLMPFSVSYGLPPNTVGILKKAGDVPETRNATTEMMYGAGIPNECRGVQYA